MKYQSTQKKLLFNMHRNLNQLRRHAFCKIITQNRNGFIVEVNLRENKYKIALEYKFKGAVDVYLLEPEIDVTRRMEIHTYGMKYHQHYKKELLKLCLVRPMKNEWDTSIALMDSYIPWAAEWTEFYELWKLTGAWHGGGEHPDLESDKEGEL